MNQLQAARDTVALMEKRLDVLVSQFDYDDVERERLLDPSLKPEHVRDMLKTMESGVNPQDTEHGFSNGKMGRWLGWMQAAVVAMGLATLDDMKAINRAASD